MGGRFALLEHDSGWTVGRITSDGPALQAVEGLDGGPDPLAESLAAALEQAGYRGEPLLLGLAQQRCLSVSMPLEPGLKRSERQALLYELEQWLPLAAEDFTADFVVQDESALAIAVESTGTAPLIDALESRGVPVQWVAPTALIALLWHTIVLPDRGCRWVLWGTERSIELFEVSDRVPRSWQSLPTDPAQGRRTLEAFLLRELNPDVPHAVVTHGLPAQWQVVLDGLDGINCVHQDEVPLVAAATLAADEVLGGRRALWIDLRRDALASRERYRAIRGPLHFCGMAVGLCLLSAIAAMHLRAYRYDELARSYETAQAAIYRQTLPGEVPVGVRRRLESEYAKLAAVSGADMELPAAESALVILHDVLGSLPASLRFRLLEIRIDRGRLHLDGEVRSHSDADTIATALRGKGFVVESPHTQQLPERGVAFQLSAIISTTAAADKEPG